MESHIRQPQKHAPSSASARPVDLASAAPAPGTQPESIASQHVAAILSKLQQQSTALNQIALRVIGMESLLEKLSSVPTGPTPRNTVSNGTHIIPKTPMADVLRESAEIRLLAPAYVPSSVSLPELVILIHLMLQTPARNIFEFGTYIGRTGLNFALNSPANARIHTLDMPTEWQAQYNYSAGRLFRDTPLNDKIVQIYGDSLKIDFTPYFNCMDFVFVDASHAYDHVLSDSMNALRMLRNGAGIIAWHDYGWQDVAPALNKLFSENGYLRPMRHIQDTSLVYVKLAGNR